MLKAENISVFLVKTNMNCKTEYFVLILRRNFSIW